MRTPPRWDFGETDSAVVRALADALGAPIPIAAVLARRGYLDPPAAEAFLRADAADLEDPYRMAGMEAAVERLRGAVERRERVFVAGDRDVDGITSTALVVSLLGTLGLEHAWHVPGLDEGYGLSPDAAERAAAAGASLLVAVDCGVRDFEGIEAARARGIDVIVLDHHEPGETLPAAVAVVDPKRRDCGYPWKGLSACGVAFKFAHAVLSRDDPHFDDTVVIFDVETTGMTPRDEIIEIGAVKAVRGEILEEGGRFQSFVRPATARVSAEITGITGITWDMVKDAPPAAEVIPRFLDFVGDATLGAHNLPFDMRFLDPAARAVGRRVPRRTLDTLDLARTHFPGRSHSLEPFAEALGIPHPEAHRALADAEVAWRVLREIQRRRYPRLRQFLNQNLDLAALSTMADVVPLRDENRAIVRIGARLLRRPVRPGLVALYARVLRPDDRASGGAVHALVRRVGEALTGVSTAPAASLKDVAWSILPTMNAAGRMGRPDLVVRLLLAASAAEAEPLAEEIAALRRERRERLDETHRAVVAQIEEAFDPARDLVVFGEAPAHGVSGAAASRLVREIGRPVAVWVREGEGDDAEATGSLRGVEGLDLTELLAACAPLVVRFGGHAGAAGFTARAGDIPALRERLNALVAERLPADRLAPTLRVDALLGPDDLGEGLLEWLDRLAPFGAGNEVPVFAALGCRVHKARTIGDGGKHLSLEISLDRARTRAVGWNMAARVPAAGDVIDAAFTVEEDAWRGEGKAQWILEAWRPAASGTMKA